MNVVEEIAGLSYKVFEGDNLIATIFRPVASLNRPSRFWTYERNVDDRKEKIAVWHRHFPTSQAAFDAMIKATK